MLTNIAAELETLPPPDTDASGTPDFQRGSGLAKRTLKELRLSLESTRDVRAVSLRAVTKLEGATE